ncbi:MAG: LysR family transcriptional regulator substrate-binding protein, partial [Bacillota bacterium]
MAEGMGISLLSQTYAVEEVAAGNLRLVPLTGFPLTREVGVAVRKNEEPSQAVRALVAASKKIR